MSKTQITLLTADCMEILKSYPNNSIDVIITSPPYNLKNKGGDYVVDSYEDKKDNAVYEKEQTEFLNECYRVLKDTGAVFYNHKNRYENNEVITPYKWVLQSNLKLKQVIIWNRKTTLDFNKSKYAPLEELIFWLYKKKTYSLKTGASAYTNIWEINRPKREENFNHRATFPYQLIYRILNTLDVDFTDKILIDPFMGTGTALQCAKQFNFKQIIGVDISKEWVEVAKQKINTFNPFTEEIPAVKNSYKDKQIKGE